jgi:hypothetical protein
MLMFCAVSAYAELSLEELMAQEESGIEIQVETGKTPVSKAPDGRGLVTNTIPQDSVLLIPESLADSIGMYDPYDGTFLGNLTDGGGRFSTPIDVIKGPDGNIYISDQVSDAVFVFDTSGTYLSTYADATDGLDNIRGIDFRNDTLYITTIHPYIARFAGPHNRLTDFITGFNSFDIHFLPDGRCLVSSHASPNSVQLYDVDGTFISQVFTISFPEQTTSDNETPGGYLDAALSGDAITDFDPDGTIYQSTPINGGRGVYRLGNGNFLYTSSSGVIEVEPGTGNQVEIEHTGSGRFIELFVLEGGTAPTGRCCYNDNAACVDTNEAACTALGGNWDAGLNCTDNPCPTGGDCDYVTGDVNGSDSYNGLDITYGVNYFKGGSDPLCPNGSCPIPPCDAFFYCGDVNGSCSYNGLDITYGVAFFKGGSAPINCPDCPPAP